MLPEYAPGIFLSLALTLYMRISTLPGFQKLRASSNVLRIYFFHGGRVCFDFPVHENRPPTTSAAKEWAFMREIVRGEPFKVQFLVRPLKVEFSPSSNFSRTLSSHTSFSVKFDSLCAMLYRTVKGKIRNDSNAFAIVMGLLRRHGTLYLFTCPALLPYLSGSIRRKGDRGISRAGLNFKSYATRWSTPGALRPVAVQ